MLYRHFQPRYFRTGFLLVVVILITFIIYSIYQTNSPPAFILHHPYFQYDLDNLEPRDEEQQSCVLPRFHPFDSSLWRFLSPPKAIVCNWRTDSLTLVDSQGWLKFNESELRGIGYEVGKSLWCSWSKVERGDSERRENLDFVISYGKKSPLPMDGVKLPSDVEILRVTCHNFVYFNIYDRLHARIREVPDIPFKANNSVNVLIFGMDSMSRLSFIRLLPLTYAFLTQDLKMTVLRGMNKVADNTYPNLVALLTGKEAYGGKLPDYSISFDSWPLIWKNFSYLGYATLWAEDFPDYGLFTYLAHGFREVPTLHYLRPFWLALKESPLLKGSSHLCYGRTPMHMLQLDYLQRFISTYSSKGRPQFGFSFLAELSHNYLSQVSSADSQFRDFLRWLVNTGQLDNTLFIFMSDHGHRYDRIRLSQLGHIEERTPFYSIRIPMTLTSRQPKILDNLLLNSARLVTPYDVYATLSDLLEFVISGRPLGQSPPPNDVLGQSLFGLIPTNRTCKDASIPPHYCICETTTSIDITDSRAHSAALLTVQHINDLLKDVADKCSPLSLNDIRSSQLVKSMEDLPVADADHQKVRVVIEVQPSAALFEATVILRGYTGEVWGDVSRINPYAGQSDCIRHAILRKYCFCVELMSSVTL